MFGGKVLRRVEVSLFSIIGLQPTQGIAGDEAEGQGAEGEQDR